MKTATRRKYGSSEVIQIEEWVQPKPTPDQILVKVHATTVNRTDCANLTAKPWFMRLFLGPFGPKNVQIGTDFAGEIVEMGSGVKVLQKGDKVCGFSDMGAKSQAEFLLVNPKDLFKIPEGLDYAEIVACLEGAHYAYSFVKRANFQPGQQILINGASGAIGSALLQMARTFELEITAISTSKNLDLLRSLGADHVIDYQKEDFTKGDKKYDFVLDAVGKRTFGESKLVLKDKGAYISSELGPYAQNVFFSLTKSKADQKVIFPIPFDKKETFPYIFNLIERGEFKPVIDREYSFQNISEAYAYVLKGQKTGNVIIRI